MSRACRRRRTQRFSELQRPILCEFGFEKEMWSVSEPLKSGFAPSEMLRGRLRETSRRSRKLPPIEKIEAVLWNDALRKRSPISLARLIWRETRV